MKNLYYLLTLLLRPHLRRSSLRQPVMAVAKAGQSPVWSRLLGLLLALLPFAASAQSAGAAFSCDGTFYITQQETNASGADRSIMSRVNRANGVVTFTQIMDLGVGLGLPATTDFVVNSLAYNPQDGYLYALTYPVGNTGFPAVNMYRIGQGGVARVGTTNITINGATPTQFPQFAAGVFDKSGNYYVAPRNIADTQYRNSLFRFTPAGNNVNATTIPLLNAAGTQLNTSATYNVGTTKSFIDLAYNPITNSLYGTYGLNMLYTFDFTTTPGSARVTQLGANPDGTSNIGSAFFDIAGFMYGYANEGGYYIINTSTGAYSLLDTDINVAVSDGGSCINPVQRIDLVKEVTSVTRINATTYDVAYTLRLRNTGTVTDAKVQVTDFLRGNALNTTFPTSTSVTITAGPTVTNLDGSALAANTTFNGQGNTADLLVGSTGLTAGQRATITFTARVVFPTGGVPSTVQNNNAYATSISGPTTANEGYSLLANGTLVPPADLTSNDASTDGANLPPLRANDSDPGDTPSPTPVSFTPSIFGTVFEDLNYGGGAGRSQNAATGIGRPGARVELYNGSGGTATFVSATTTDTDGNYSFLNLTAGNTYTVRVASNTVTSSRPGAVAGLLPVQTFANGDVNRVGGEDPQRVDGGNVTVAGALLSTLNTAAVGTIPGTTAQSITTIALPASIASPFINVDFGFNFDAVVNNNARGQGSLAQFITNANTLTNTGLAQVGQTAGKEVSIFMVSDGAAHPGLRTGLANMVSGTGTARRVIINQTGSAGTTNGLPIITDANTVIDGSTQTTNIGDSNTTLLGTATTVGVGGLTLAAVNGPEVEITGTSVTTVLDIEATNTTVRGIAIRGGITGLNNQTVLIGNTASATGYLFENDVIGTSAISTSWPGDLTVSGGYGLNIRTNAGIGTIQNSSIAYTGYSGLHIDNLVATVGTTSILGNRFEQNGYQNAGGDAITLGDQGGSGPMLIQGNLFTNPNSSAVQFEIGSTAASTISNNTITGAGTGGAALATSSLEGGGIVYLQRDGTKRGTQADMISNNVISTSQAAGIVIGYGQQNVTMTQNSTFGNGGPGIDVITNAAYFVGSTNVTGAAQYGNGDGVSSNDGTIGAANSPLPNRGIDYPIFTSTSLSSGTSATVTGYIGNTAGAAAFAGATIEVYVADNSPANQDGAVSTGNATVIAHGEGVTYVGTLTADAGGNFTGTLTAPAGVTFTNTTFFTATARLASVGTSEFGPNRRLNTAPVAVADVTNTPNNTAITFAVTANDTDADGNGTINTATIDLDPATAGIQTSFTVAGGTFTTVGVTPGSVKFTPLNSAFTDVATTPYTVQDIDGATSNSASLTVNVGPLTTNDASSTAYNVPTSANVTTNDTDVNGINAATVDLDPATAGIQTTFTTANGTFSAATTGIVTYTPNAGSVFVGTQSVNYVVFDNLTGNAALSSVGTYTVTLTNAAPVAVADVTNTPNNTPVTFAVTANDTDANGNGTINLASIDLDPATTGIQTSFTVAGGTFTTVGVTPGSVKFTPINSAFTGVATTPYTVSDATGQVSNSASLTVNVGPLTANDASSTAYNTAVSLNVTTNDTDSNGKNVATVDLDPTTAGVQTTVDYVVGGLTVGTFSVATTGVVTYTPAANSVYVGTASVNYVFFDNVAGNAALSSVGTYTVTLINAAPVAVADVTNTPNNTAVTFAVTANDTDANGNGTINLASIDLDPATTGIQTSFTVAGGTFTTVGVTAGSVKFTPINSAFTGVATTPYTVSDVTGQVSNSVNFSVNVGPLTANDASSTAYNTAVSLNVTTNDTDANGINAATVDLDPTTAGIQTTFATANGTFSVAATGIVTYTPNAGSLFVGTQSVNYVVFDNLTGNVALSSVGTYTVTLTNAAPVAVADTRNTPNNTPITFNVTANDTDADGNSTINVATVDLNLTTAGIQSSITVAGQGTFTVDNLGNVTFTPVNAAFTGVATTPYTVQDATGQVSNQIAISVNVGPLTTNDASSTGYNTAVSLNVTTNDTDANGINAATVDLDPATAGIQTTFATANGTFSVATTGIVTYTPNAGSVFTGTQSVSYVVFDNLTGNAALSSVGTYTVTLTNAAPVAVADVTNTPNNTPVTFAVTANDTDANGNGTINLASIDLDPATAGIQTSFTVAGGTFTTVGAPAGSVIFTPLNSAFTGVALAAYTVQDATGQVSNSVNISVNVGPLTANDASSTAYNTAVSLNVTTNDTDSNGKNVATVDLDPTTAGVQTTVDYVVGGLTVGTFSVATTGVVTYTPAVNSVYVGTASVNYVFFDNVAGNAALSSVGTYTVTLTNAAPVAVANFFATPNNTTLTASAATNIVANDTDANGNATIVASTVDLDPSTPGVLDQTNVPATNGGGTFSVNALGQITFTPINASYTDVATISYTVQDNTGQVSNVTTVSVNVGPRTADDAATTAYNVAVTTNVTANDVDVQGIRANTIDLDPTTPGTRETSVPFVVGGVTVGTFSTSGTSSILYTPAAGSTYVGTASVQYLVYDAQTPTATASAYSNTATYTVTLTNAAPVAVANLFATPNNTTLTASAATNIVANDTDANGNATIVASTVDLDPSTPGVLDQTNVPATNGGGTFSVNALGQITFTPITANYTDVATISYTVQDNTGQVSNVTTVSVNVGPNAADDAATTAYNVAVTTNVTANDVDVQGIRANTIDLDPTTPGTRETSVPFVVGGVTVGTFSTNGTSSIRYTPAVGSTYTGTASVQYLVYDAQTPTATASAYSNTATYTVTLGNTAPVAVNDANGAIPNTPVTFSILANDTDANGNATIVASTIDLDPNTAGIQTSITVAGQGTFTTVGAPAGSVTFTPVATFTTGTATTPYTVQDEVGATSNQATISVSIAGPPFSCNSVFYRVTLSPSTTTSVLERLDRTSTSTSGLTYASSTIYDTGVQLNALFLNYTDGYLYAFGLGSNRLYRLSSTGVQDLGLVAGLPAGGFNAATADLSGNAYIANNQTSTLYRLQVSTRTVTALTLSQPVNFGDMGYNPADGNIYASRYYPGGIYKIDLNAAGATRPVTTLGTPATTGEDVGSIFFDAAGLLYAATNQGTLAGYNTQNGSTANIGTASVAAQSDGASCVFPVEEIDVVQSAAAPVRVNATTFDVTFTTQVRNTGAVIDPNVQINDLLAGSTNATFPTAASVTIVGAPVITGAGAATLTSNPAFTGQGANTGLLTGTGALAINASATITYTVRVTYASIGSVPTATQFDQVYASAAGSSPNTGYTFIGGVAVPPSQVLDGEPSTNSTTLPATPNGDTPSPTPIVFSQPLAFDDVYTTPSNTAVTVNPVGNDQPGNTGAPLLATTIDLNPALAGQQTTVTVTGGTFSLITTGPNAGQVTFTPDNNFTGTATTPYTVQDNTGGVSSIATITVHVGPVAVANTSTTPYNVPVSVNVTTNDIDVDGVNAATVDLNPATAGIQTSFPYVVGGVTVGTFTVANTGIVTYTPAAGATYTGNAVVTYTVQDSFGATSNPTTYTVTLTSTAPVAVNDTRNTPQATPITFSVTANDTDADGNATIAAATVDLDPATAGIQHTFTVAGQGTFTTDNAGNVTFTPVAGFTDVATITYTVQDVTGQVSNAATIAVNVGPLALNDAATTAYNTPVSLNVTTNDTDANGLRLNSVDLDLDPSAPGRQTTFTVAGQGTFTVNNTGNVTFTPSGTFVGTTSVNYVIFDALTGNAALSNVATFTVTTTNAAPVAVNDTRNTPQATPITFSVTANDTDADGNATIVTATVDLDPTTAGIQHTFTVAGQGTFTADNAGNVTFTPVAGFTDVATITYTVQDVTGQVSNAATIAVNVGPLTQNDVATTGYTTNVQLTVLGNDADANGLNAATVDLDPNTTGRQTTFTVAGQGTFTVNNAGVVTFNPSDTFVGTTTISYVVFDALTGNAALSNPSTITVTTTNTAPVAVNDSRNTPSNTPISFNPSANDTDANGNGTVVDASVDLDPATPGQQTTLTVAGEGTYTLDAAGLLTFTPALNYTGTSSISYTVLDNQGLISNVATITINVGPLAANDVAYTTPNTAGTVNVTTNDTDANGLRVNQVDLAPATNGRQNTFTVPGEGTFTVNATGVVTFTPVLNYTGSSTINYTLPDQTGSTSNVATITFHVGPLAANDVATTAVNAPVSLNVTTNDTDIEGVAVATVDLDPTTAGIQTTFTVAGQGTFTVNAAGVVTFTPTGTFTGTTTIPYTVQDVNGAVSNVATITITLQNTAPVAVADEYSTPSNTAVTFSVTANDTDAENNLSAATVDLDPATAGIQTTRTVAGQGTFTVDNAGNVTFTPALNYTGSSTISYTVQDATGATSAPVGITVHVGPIATNDTATSNLGQAVRLTAGTSDIDAEGVALATVDLDPATPGIQTTFTVAGQGTFTVDGTSGEVIFTPDRAFAGAVVSIPYVVSDVNGAVSNVATLSVSVTPYNDVVTTISGTTIANAADPVTYTVSTVNNGPSTAQNVVVSVQLLPNLRNPNGTPFSVTGATYTPSTGLLVYNSVAALASGQTLTNTFAFRMPDTGFASGVASSTANGPADAELANNNGSQNPAIITTSGAPLPVELIGFTAKARRQDAVLTWATAQEKNSAYFVVERSFTGRDFVEVARRDGAGTTFTRHDYTATDANVGRTHTGLVYYRLRQVDTDGTTSFSNIEAVSFEKAANGTATVYPNPTVGDATLDLSDLASGTCVVTVFDAAGRAVVAAQTVEAGLTHPMSIAGLPVGTYLVRIQTADGQVQTLRLMRQ